MNNPEQKAIESAFRSLVQSVNNWTEHHMDQWEKFKYVTSCGNTVYVTISMHDDYPNSFDLVDGITGDIINQAGLPPK